MSKVFEYEESVKRLEEIVRKLESGELSLDDSVKLYEEGTRLSAECYKKLKNAEQKITELSEIVTGKEEEST